MRLRGSLFLVPACCALLILGSGCTAGKKPGPAEAAQRFFDLVAKGELRAAYDSASFGFRAQQTFSNFDAVVKELGLADYESVSWTSQNKGRSETTLEGEVSSKTAGK